MTDITDAENEARMQRGELYYAFKPSLVAKRKKAAQTVHDFNSAHGASRRKLVELWKAIADDNTPLPPPASTEEEDEILLQDEPYIDAPITKVDYGFNVKLGKGVYVNSNATFIDTCPITIGARTMMGPNCSFYSGKHPIDPFLRNGIKGPEDGMSIVIEEDCWLGGNAIVLPGTTIGRGSTVGAGSVVTGDVPRFCVLAGNPARILRSIEPKVPNPNPDSKALSDEVAVAAASIIGPV
ncbi:hypothetical protein HYALB_00013059 [Hymenoscyphus albidus]|uniref:Maltose/galactoside acetyltransferase domain-containing protein n=1 Tax=Hymenoscyphus albidus TaxID=595503 RepID=A0A9N9LTW1_9HELO|nr:hypothetical protein HYALB_00013059 [Hymenoscyphus albidus]